MLIMLQGLAAICSLTSTLTIINIWNTNNLQARGVVIISFAVIQWMIHLWKFCELRHSQLKHGGIIATADYDEPKLASSTKMVVVGIVDAVVDIIIGIAYIINIEEIINNHDNTELLPFLVGVSSMTGFAEQLLEFAVVVIQWVSERSNSSSLRISVMWAEFIGSLFELATMLFVVGFGSKENDIDRCSFDVILYSSRSINSLVERLMFVDCYLLGMLESI